MKCLRTGVDKFQGESLRFHSIVMTSSDALVLLFLYSYQSQFNKFIDLNFPEFTNVFFNNLDLRDGYLKDLVAPQASNFFLHQTNLNQTDPQH